GGRAEAKAGRRLRWSWASLQEVGKKPFDTRRVGPLSDDDDPALRHAVGPIRQPFGTMDDMLHRVQHHRRHLAFDGENGLEAKQISPALVDELVEPSFHPWPGKRSAEATRHGEIGAVRVMEAKVGRT